MTYAYARVSTKEQNLERQIEAFKKYDVTEKNIYFDKDSGKDFNRKNYIKLIKKLKKGDLLIIKSIDRLGRNYDMIVDEWNFIINKIEADILVIDIPLLDTRNQSTTLTNKLIYNLVLQILSYVAENERNNIRQRQAEGIKIAKEKGIKFGRPKKDIHKYKHIFDDYLNKKITSKEAINLSKLSKSNFYYHIKKYKK